MISIVAQYICEAFLSRCGKFQCRKPEAEQKAMLVEFDKSIDHDKEDGYRHFELMIYGPANYVQVWVRETWNVIPLDDLEYNAEEDESFVKPGKSYDKGASPWQLIGDHDSGWRGRIQDFLRSNEKEITHARKLGELVPASNVPEITEESRKGTIKV